jgi:hypothetical protein
MTRIGRVKVWDVKDPVNPRFSLVVEEGKMTLACWRYVGDEEQKAGNYSWQRVRGIFERIS